MKSINVGLVKGRHEIPEVTNYIFKGTIENPSDFGSMWKVADDFIGDMDMSIKEINLYVTGLTAALIEVLNVAKEYGIKVNLFHYNPLDGKYYKQEVKF